MGVRKEDGSFPPSDGNLFAYNGTAKPLIKKIGIANGLTWSLDENTFYFIDSLDSRLKAFDYNPKTVTISTYNDKVFLFIIRQR